jgi:hypothetical protein
MTGTIPLLFWPGLLITLALLVAFAWLLVRHTGLALLTVLAPLPGMGLADLGVHTPPVFSSYVPGFIVAAFLTSVIAPLAASTPARQAVRETLRALWPALVAIFVLFIPVAFMGALYCSIGVISAVAVTAPVAMLLSYDENFVVRINRAGENRLQEMERLAFLTIPRWGMSIGGIALVFCVLGFFGAQASPAAISVHPVLFCATAFVFLAGAFAITRNIRRALAAFLTMAPVVLLTLSLSARLAFPSIGLLVSLAAAAIPVLFMASAARIFERGGDSAETSTGRGIERFGATVAITTVASAAGAILAGFRFQDMVVEGSALLLGGAAALILQPALTTMLYTLFPRRISLEEAFRKP